MLPAYRECIERALPIFTSFVVKDANEADVVYERLLLPFMTSGNVDHIIASVKPISENGDFVVQDLMLNSVSPVQMVCAVIDTNLTTLPARRSRGDEII